MEFFTAMELAKRWKLKDFRTVYRYRQKGLIRSKKVGGQRLFSESAVLDFENGKSIKR